MQRFYRELHDAAVIGHETVELVLHVAQLRVHRGAEALRDGGADLLVIECLERILERERGVARLVADALAADGVALDAVDIAAETFSLSLIFTNLLIFFLRSREP